MTGSFSARACTVLVVGSIPAGTPVFPRVYGADAGGSFGAYGAPGVRFGAGPEVLPLSLAVGGWLLEQSKAASLPRTYWAMPTDAVPDECVRLGGSVNVLGIASVSVEFYLGLKYQDPPNELWGQASLTVEVEVLCFSKSFSFTVERRIAGGDTSASLMGGVLAATTGGSKLASLPAKTKPAFNITDLMNKDEWSAYAEAFATS